MISAKERWKDIPNFEGLYQASSFGRIKSLGNACARKEKILKGAIAGTGYFYVTLWKKGKHKRFRLSRIIAITFIKSDDSKMDVNHINGNKLDNRIENLEWLSRSDNHLHAYRRGLKLPPQSKSVLQCDLNGTIIKKWDSVIKASSELNFKISNISACALGKRKRAYGFTWKYL